MARIASTVSAEIFELWRILYIRRMDLDRWELIPSCEPPLLFEIRLGIR